jgi:hypothetical protein
VTEPTSQKFLSGGGMRRLFRIGYGNDDHTVNACFFSRFQNSPTNMLIKTKNRQAAAGNTFSESLKYKAMDAKVPPMQAIAATEETAQMTSNSDETFTSAISLAVRATLHFSAKPVTGGITSLGEPLSESEYLPEMRRRLFAPVLTWNIIVIYL